MPLFALAVVALAQVPVGAIKIEFDKDVSLSVASAPVAYQGNKLSIVTVTQARFVKEPFRVSLTSPEPGSALPGIYGVRWGSMPPKGALGQPTIKFEHGPFLRVTAKASVVQYNDVDYRICCAVFDKKGHLLGAAVHTESVRYVRFGQMPTIFHEIVFDFGASKAFEDAAYAALSISEPAVPPAPDGG